LIDESWTYPGDEFDLLKEFSKKLEDVLKLIDERNMTDEEKERREKEKYLAERQRRIEEEFKKKHEEEEKLKHALELDREEQAKREKPHDSIA